MKVKKDQLKTVVKSISHTLQGEKYAIRGTAGLVLQGLGMNVDDVDILCDAKTALSANTKLSEYLVEKVELKESSKFKSYFGKFLIDGVKVEIMGDWQIFNAKKDWSKVYTADPENITHVKADDIEIPVTTVELELEVFALMGRWTAYQKIKRLIEESSKPQSEQSQSISDQQNLF